MTSAFPPALADLAAAHGVAVSYENWAGEPTAVAPESVTKVLAALGVDAGDPAAALRATEEARAGRLVAPTVVARSGSGAQIVVRAPVGAAVSVIAELEAGGSVELPVGPATPRRGEREERAVRLPADVPTGWHRLQVQAGQEQATATLIVAPPRIELPPVLRDGRTWGWMVQLYSVRSAGSWGMGDYGDLTELVRWSGEEGAGVLLCNPLHAPTPVHPVQPSPYYPSSRRFRSPLYLRLAGTPEYAAADARTRGIVDACAPKVGDRIDRDDVWSAKLAALELLLPLSREPERAAAVAAFREQHGQGLVDFATFCALAERHGVPWQEWPRELRRPDSPAVEQARQELAERVDLHIWLQLLCDEQLAATADAAAATGMSIGVIHDLAVGVDPGGADAWALQDALAHDARVGAPPDSFNQRGQDWGLPPWHPEALAELGYAPFRDLVRSVLRHAGGIRIDHVMGLFRLWWVPADGTAAEGTYVYYDAEALLAVLALEAHAAGALVVGEDRGTVEKSVSDALADNGVLGSAVLWFEKDDDDVPLPPSEWRPLTMASVTTHDLPTAAGFLANEHVRVRAELGQLGHSVETEEQRVAAERDALLALLVQEGLLDPDASAEGTVLAMHEVLVRAPSKVVMAALGDATGDLRQPNLPGTRDEYPNWRLPVADGTGRPVPLEELRTSGQVDRLVRLLQTVSSGREAASDSVSASPTPLPRKP